MKILSKKSVREFCTSVQSISKFRPTFTLAGEYNSPLCLTKIFPFLLFTLHNGQEIEMKTLAVNCEDKSVNLDRKQNAYDFKSVKLRAKTLFVQWSWNQCSISPPFHFHGYYSNFTHMKDYNFHHYFYFLNFGKSKVNAHLRPGNIFKTSCFKNIKLQ